MDNPIASELQLLVNLNHPALVEFGGGTRILHGIHGQDARTTSANCTSSKQPLSQNVVCLTMAALLLPSNYPC